MKSVHRIMIVMILSGAMGLPAAAQMREVDQDELRRSVQTGQSVPLSRIMSRVSASVEGQILDVRAFEGGGIYYRVLIKQPNGRLGSVILDAKSGQFMRANSQVAQDVVRSAKSSRSSGNKLNAQSRAGNAKQSGGSNDRGQSSNANSNSNSGGGNSGGGNSGGGNSGGGNGNSGGGGGNSGGGGGNSSDSNAGGNGGGNSSNSNAGGNGGGNSSNSNAGGKK